VEGVSIASPSRFHHLKQQTIRLPILGLHLHLLLLDLIPITNATLHPSKPIHIHRLIFFKINMSAAFTSYGHMLFLFCEVFFHTIDCEALRWWWGECVWVFRDGVNGVGVKWRENARSICVIQQPFYSPIY